MFDPKIPHATGKKRVARSPRVSGADDLDHALQKARAPGLEVDPFAWGVMNIVPGLLPPEVTPA